MANKQAAKAWDQLVLAHPSLAEGSVEHMTNKQGQPIVWLDYFDPSHICFTWDGDQWVWPAELTGPV